MSVERIQLLHEDYIRLTERFKALWTFHQFLRGVQKTFFASEPSYALDFGKLYDDVRAVAGTIDTTSPEKVAPRLRELAERLDAFSRKLREADRHISPSYVRRFFEKVQPQDEKIAFHLLRFYFSQPDVDEDVVDKVDFLATVVAAGPGRNRGRHRAAASGHAEVLRVRVVDVGLAPLGRDDAADDRARVRRARRGHGARTGVRGSGHRAPAEQRPHDEAPRRERPRESRGAGRGRVVQPEDAVGLPASLRPRGAPPRGGHGAHRRPREGADPRRARDSRPARSSSASTNRARASSASPARATSRRCTSSSSRKPSARSSAASSCPAWPPTTSTRPSNSSRRSSRTPPTTRSGSRTSTASSRRSRCTTTARARCAPTSRAWRT